MTVSDLASVRALDPVLDRESGLVLVRELALVLVRV